MLSLDSSGDIPDRLLDRGLALEEVHVDGDRSQARARVLIHSRLESEEIRGTQRVETPAFPSIEQGPDHRQPGTLRQHGLESLAIEDLGEVRMTEEQHGQIVKVALFACSRQRSDVGLDDSYATALDCFPDLLSDGSLVRRRPIREFSDVAVPLDRIGDLCHQRRDAIHDVRLLDGRRTTRIHRPLDRQFDGIARLYHEVAQRLGAMCDEEAVRVFAAGERGCTNSQPFRQQGTEGPLHRLAPGVVAVEEQNDLTSSLGQLLGVLGRERRTAGGKGFSEPGARERNTVEVALADDRPLGLTYLGERMREAVEDLALAKDRSLRGVQVLGLLSLAQGPAPESNGIRPRKAS